MLQTHCPEILAMAVMNKNIGYSTWLLQLM